MRDANRDSVSIDDASQRIGAQTIFAHGRPPRSIRRVTRMDRRAPLKFM
jgi:hypothetical protein